MLVLVGDGTVKDGNFMLPLLRLAYSGVSTVMSIGSIVQPKLLQTIHQPFKLHPGSNLGQSQSQSQDSFNHSNVVDWYVEN